MKQKKEIAEPVVFTLVQFYAVVLFECNEAEDYGPAMTLMNTAFSFHHERTSLTHPSTPTHSIRLALRHRDQRQCALEQHTPEASK